MIQRKGLKIWKKISLKLKTTLLATPDRAPV